MIKGGRKQLPRPKQQYITPSLRTREKAGLDAKQQNIYKPALLTYYVELTLELFPSKVKSDSTNETASSLADQKNSFICNKRRIAIQSSFQSVKQTFKAITSATTTLIKDAVASPMYTIPSIAYVLTTVSSTLSKPKLDLVTVNLQADDNIQRLLQNIKIKALTMSKTIDKTHISVLPKIKD